MLENKQNPIRTPELPPLKEQIQTAVIMAGGKGTRLRPLTAGIPKPLVPVAGECVLSHTLRLLARHGIRRAILTLQYRGGQIRETYGDSFEGVALQYVEESTPLGTAGGVKNALLAAGETQETVLVMSGDTVCDFDLHQIIRRHFAQGAAASIGLVALDNPDGFGLVQTDPIGRITAFLEKPPRSVWQTFPLRLINTGVYLLSPAFLQRIAPHTVADFGRQIFPRALRDGVFLLGVEMHGYWCDIGTADAFYRCNFEVAAQADSKVRRHFCAQHSIAGKDCHIAPGAKVERCILMNEITVEPGAHLEGAILCDRVRIGENVTVGRGAIIGPGVILPPNTAVAPGTVYT